MFFELGATREKLNGAPQRDQSYEGKPDKKGAMGNPHRQTGEITPPIQNLHLSSVFK